MKISKRLLALALAFLLTASCFPTSIFAVGGATTPSAPAQVIYDFDLAGNYSDTISGADNLSVEGQWDAAKALYDADSINWIYEGKGVVEGGNGVFSQNKLNKNVGIRVYASNYNWWYAIRIKAPGTGTYAITVNTYTATSSGVQKHSIWTEAYLFDAAPIDAEEATIVGSLTAANRLDNDFAPLTAQPDADLGNYTFTEGKEYILVFRQTNATYTAANADGLRTTNLYLSGLTLDLSDNTPDETTGAEETTTTAPGVTTTAPEETTTTPEETTTSPEETTTSPAQPEIPDSLVAAGYSFNLRSFYGNLVNNNFSVEDDENLAYTQALYNAGKVNWLYVGKQNGTTASGAPTESFSKNYYNGGVQVNCSGYNWWYAIKVKAPGTGTYDVTIDTNTANSGGVQKHSVWTETYIFDAALVTGETGINDLLTESNQYNNFAPTVDNTATCVGNVAFEAGKEYIIVLRQTRALFTAAAADGLGTNNLYLKELSFVEAEPDPEAPPVVTPPEIVIPENLAAAGNSFDLKYYYDNLITGNFSVEDAENLAYTQALYAAGKINWLYAGKLNGTTASGDPTESFTKNYYNKGFGIQVQTSGYNWWYAIKVKAPGTGTYDVTINTNTVTSGELQKHSVWTETYIFDAALVTGETTINDLLTDANKYQNFAPTTENPAAFLGNVAFEAGKEYIIVLRNTRTTHTNSNIDGLKTSNLYLKDISFVEAEPQEIEVPKAGYNFDLLNVYLDGPFLSDLKSVTEQKALLQEYFSAGHISWTFEDCKNGTKDLAGKGEIVDSFYQNKFNKGRGIEIRTAGYNWWYAIKVKAPGTGTYDVTLNTLTANASGVQKHSLWTETYIFDASKVTGNVSIDDLLTEENRYQNFAPTVDKTGAFLGNFAFTAGKDYIIVLKTTSSTRTASNADGLGTANLYLKDISFVEAEPKPIELPEVPKTGYDFDLAGNYPDEFTASAIEEQVAKIKEFYDKGYIDWSFHSTGVVKNGKGVVNTNRFSKSSGVTVYASNNDWYYAIRFRSPGAGAHKVEVATYLTGAKDADGNPIKKHSVWADAYIMEASLLDNGKTTFEDFMLKRNLLGSFAPTVDNPTAELGYYSFEAGKEYILFLRQSKTTLAAGKEDGLGTNNLYLEGLKFTYTANPPEKVVDNSKVLYDFDLGDAKTGIMPSNTYINEKIDEISKLYDLEELNWELAAPGGTDARFKTAGGLTSYGKADDYIAFRIQSPGKGLYTLTLNHGQGGRGATGAVYVIPGDSPDIAYAMDNHNRVGKVPFYNETGDVGITDGLSTVLGTWEFGSAKEYIVVIEAYETSPFYQQAYMYISSLLCEKGDKTASAQGERKPHSVVVDPAPVKLVEACTYQAIAEINGDDYLFLPLEGRKMAVYNIDKGILVDYVDTSHGQVKGIGVDKDGIVWMVGDNPNIFRYDPVLNVGQVVCRYKNTTGVERTDSILKAEVGFGMAFDDKGCLYFGVMSQGDLAKYNTITGEFTNMGKAGVPDANSYACSPVCDGDYVYITTTGDMNSDGVKTMSLSKYNTVTNQLVARKDITPYVSQQEVMIRGMGICEGVLILGGERNDVKQAAAFDAETLEFVDIGIAGSCLYGPTAVRDGKMWFTAGGGLGLIEYDGATRTAKPVKGLEIVTNAIRNGFCFMTVEGNDLFPGESIAYYRSNTLEIVVLNVETGTVMPLSGIVKEEYGSTSDIRPIVKVPGAENLLYMGSFNTDTCAVYDVDAGMIIQNFETEGQTDAILVYEGNLYVGNYNAGVLVQINKEDPNRNVRLLGLKALYKQSRIHTLAGGDGKVFLGSMPDRYEYGGCLAWVDIETMDSHVERHVVQDQSIISLAYHKSGYVIGGSSITAGSGALIKEGLSAKFFTYDVANKQKVAEYDLREMFSNMPKTITGIDGLMVDDTGKVWMVAAGSLFTFELDNSGKAKNIKQVLETSTTTTSDKVPSAMIVDGDYLYVNTGSVGGIRKVNMKNPSDNVQIPVPFTDAFALGNDGNLYYCQKEKLCMYPLEISDADWVAADAWDATIKNLGRVTLDSEQTIIDIRTAYENLSWTQKGLAANLDLLVAAEIDLLECKIDAIGEVTMDDKDLITALKAEYQTLSAKNKTYVKNYYTVLIPAITALQALIDAEEAARVQALIDTIPGMGEITLEKEAAIRKIETEYNALTKSQKALVDAAALKTALEKIAALRQERINYLNDLIAGLGEITLEDEAAILEAKSIFDWLSLYERKKVDFLTLNAAETTLKKLQKAAAAEVDALIEAIGDTVGYGSGKAIQAARAAYDALTEGSKQYVKLLPILEEAELLFAELTPIWVFVVIGVVVVLAAGATVFVILRKKKASVRTES